MQQLNKQITYVIEKLQISKSELSRRLGHARGYLSEVQRVGVSTDKQAELIAKIQRIGEGHVYISNEHIMQTLIDDLNNIRKTSQNAAERILELERINDTIDSENDELRKTVRKQDSKIAFLNITLNQANENAMLVPVTALAALVLFFKLLFGGKA